MARARWTLVAAAAAGGVSVLVRHRRPARNASPPPPPPVTTQSSPGQIADLQQAYGAEMDPSSANPPAAGTADA
jgi:hypothetical protein